MSFLTTDPSFSTQFFKSAILAKHLAHGYVLKGKDYAHMYRTILELAKALNCQNPASPVEPCGKCSACHWTDSNTHPSVITVSRLTYLVGDNGEELGIDDLEKLSKKPQQTLIKTDQIGRLIRQLGISSKDYRVVIFTDAEVLPASQPSTITPPYDWAAISANEDKQFHLRPLHRGLFNAESANRFLKTLEEPPAKTLFFFITDSEQNLLETIVSRCQTVPVTRSIVQSEEAPVQQPLSEVGLQLCMDWQDAFYSPNPHDIYPALDEFQRILVDHEGLSMEQALTGLQSFMRQHYLEHQKQDKDELPFARYRQIQRAIEQAISMIHSKTNEAQVLQQLFWHLAVKQAPKAPFIPA